MGFRVRVSAIEQDWEFMHSGPRLLAIKKIIETGEIMVMKNDNKE